MDDKRSSCPYCKSKNPVIHGYQKNGLRRHRCKQCNSTFNERTKTPLARLRTPAKDVIESLHMFVTGTTEADIARIKGVTEKTVHRWVWKAAGHCITVSSHFLNGIKAFFIQLDELYAFIRTKANRQWVWTCTEAFSRLLVCFALGKRRKKAAEGILQSVKPRLCMNPAVITSDGLHAYTELVPEMFPTSLYAQVVKKYERRKLKEIELRAINGTLKKIEQMTEAMGLGKTVNTSCVERLNLTIRNSVNSLARKSWCLAKKYLGMAAKMHVFQAFYNFVRTHMSLEGRTPAMAAGLTHHVWTWYELLTCRPDG